MSPSEPILFLILQVLFLAITLLCFGSFLWSVIGVFRKPKGSISVMYRVLQVSSVWTWVYSIYAISLKSSLVLWVQIPALILALFSLWIFWATRNWIKEKDFSLVFNNEAPSHLETCGPFSWVRHPFYSSYLLCYFSVVLFTLDLLMAVTVIFMVALYFKALNDEERKFQLGEFSEAYNQYREKTGALFPKFFIRG